MSDTLTVTIHSVPVGATTTVTTGSTPIKVWLVGVGDVEGSGIHGAYSSYEKALASWNKLRLEMIEHFKEFQAQEPDDMWIEEIKNLSNDNPETINNYPHDCPFIREIELDGEIESFL